MKKGGGDRPRTIRENGGKYTLDDRAFDGLSQIGRAAFERARGTDRLRGKISDHYEAAFETLVQVIRDGLR